jgi:hypothetical protein
MARACSTNGEEECLYYVGGKARKKESARKRHKCEDNIKMGFRELDRLCGLVVRVLGYRSGGPGSIPSTTRKKNVVGLEWGALSLVSTN